jgi:hypothetical protein
MSHDSPPPKRRRVEDFTLQSGSVHVLPPAPTGMRGQAFLSGIDALAKGANTSVYAQLDLPYKERVSKTSGRGGLKTTTVADEARRLDNHGTFATMVQSSAEGTKQWTQGLLMPMGATSYFDKTKMGRAVPSTMTMNTATMESRAMKFLANDALSYTPKNDIVAQGLKGPTEAVGNGDKALSEAHHWGGLAMGSFLEEITATRGLGLNHVGSAMRAQTMASKWRMKATGATSEAGFGDKMLTAFPQLGKQDMTPKLGASVLWDQITAGGTKRDTVMQQHLGLGGSIYKAHDEARRQAKQQFTDKFAKAQTGTAPDTLGKWWGVEARKPGFADLADPQNSAQFKQLRSDYVDTKLTRHGVVPVPSPRQIAGQAFKREFAETGTINRKTDPVAYKQAKHTAVVATLEGAGFDASKIKASRIIKDNFARKLEVLKGGEMPKGKWWDGKVKSGVDFKTLAPQQRVALKQEYLASRKAKK